jgi:hypothetical protein
VFIGHFALGFAAKRAAPRASLAVLFGAAQLADLLWPVLLAFGVEQVRIDPGNTAFTPLDFASYPWSHSLLMAAVWAWLFGAGHYMIRKDLFTAKVLGAVVFSHWVLDWITHRPDLQLAPGLAFKTGLGLWNSVAGTVAVEAAFFLAAAWWYDRATEPLDAVGRWAWLAMILLLLSVYGANLGSPPLAGQERMIPIMCIPLALFIPWAAWVDRHRVFHG